MVPTGKRRACGRCSAGSRSRRQPYRRGPARALRVGGRRRDLLNSRSDCRRAAVPTVYSRGERRCWWDTTECLHFVACRGSLRSSRKELPRRNRQHGTPPPLRVARLLASCMPSRPGCHFDACVAAQRLPGGRFNGIPDFTGFVDTTVSVPTAGAPARVRPHAQRSTRSRPRPPAPVAGRRSCRRRAAAPAPATCSDKARDT